MGKQIFKEKHFNDKDAARAWFETARWPEGRVCPTCGSLKSYATKKAGRYRCGEKECRRDFTVMTGTVMERSHAKLTQWAAAFYMAASSKKGFSAHQLHRALGCQYNTAWFLHHRVMEAMRRGGLELPPMGGQGKIVEADETYFGHVKNPRNVTRQRKAFRKQSGGVNKRSVVAIVEHGGSVRSFHVPRADKVTVQKIVRENIARESRLHTDESKLYFGSHEAFAAHETVNHAAKEYVREGGFSGGLEWPMVTTNTVEGYFSIFKRGMKGVYQHCSEKHLHRYLAEFDFRYNTREALGWNDETRTLEAIRGAEGKRLTYHQPR
jgi:transposase-like protein